METKPSETKRPPVKGTGFPDRHRRLTSLEGFLMVIGLGGCSVVFAVIAVYRVIQFAIDQQIEDLLWGLVAAVLAVGCYLWLRRSTSSGLWRKVAPMVAVAMPLSLAVAVGTSDTTLAACSTIGYHVHWRSSTDKFESSKEVTTCWQTANRADGGCTSWYNAKNYFYYCSQDIGGYCYWRHTGTISRHHTHKCSW